MQVIKEAVVLAGGLGTRLRSVISEIPKPMAPVNEKPFLEYLLHYLKSYGINRVVLSVGFKYEVIKQYFGTRFLDIELVYVVEKEPLGTGGGIKLALEHTRDVNVFLLNGDTFFNVNLHHLEKQFLASGTNMCLSLKEMTNFDRYGIVTFNDAEVVGFCEKTFRKNGWINGGVYAINSSLFAHFNFPDKFSFEKDFMEKYCSEIPFSVFLSHAYFIDIGIPEDYQRANDEFGDIDLFK